jgi:hypothetical protein
MVNLLYGTQCVESYPCCMLWVWIGIFDSKSVVCCGTRTDLVAR